MLYCNHLQCSMLASNVVDRGFQIWSGYGYSVACLPRVVERGLQSRSGYGYIVACSPPLVLIYHTRGEHAMLYP
jgi:hypothetical protein